MKTITLSNLPWRVWSPSLLELVGGGSPNTVAARIVIAYNGKWWVVGFGSTYGTAEYPSRDAAAAMVAKAFTAAQNWDTGA